MKVLISASLMLAVLISSMDARASFCGIELNGISPFKGLVSNGYSRMYSKDPRMAMSWLSKHSPTLSKIEAASSPLSISQLYFHNEAPNKGPVTNPKALGLSKELEGESVLVGRLSAAGSLKTHEQQFLSFFEKRVLFLYWISEQYALQTGGQGFFDGQSFENTLLNLLLEVTEEIQSEKPRFFSPQLIGEIEGIQATQWNSARGLPELVDERVLSSPFLENLSRNLEKEKGFSALSLTVSEFVEETEAGMALNQKQGRSNIRLGDYHFQSSYGSFRTDSRSKIMTLSKLDRWTEAVFNLTNEQKTKLSLVLDRGHQTLDPIFGIPVVIPCGATCGTYPARIYLRSGVPILFTTYGTPSPIFTFLAIKKWLGSSFVKEVYSMNQKGERSIPSLATMALRDVGFYLETAIVGTGLYFLVDGVLFIL
ncbi:MAG: hypothetical protein AAF202_05120 [Pseudomonadota bacterium]